MTQTRNIFENTREEVVQLLQWDMESMNVAIYEKALEWLEVNISNDQMGIDALTSDPDFWHWWKRQWHFIDRRLLATAAWQNCPALTRVERYLNAHSPMVMNVFPGTQVLQNSYSRMIQKVIERCHQEALVETKNQH